jgi:hypothetical protein
MNQNKLKDNESHLKLHHIPEIQSGIKFIDGIAKKNGVLAIVVIPPVHESIGRSSSADKILSQALSQDLHLADTVFIDHRQLKIKTDPTYFYEYDHPSPKYGELLYNEINSLLAESNG